MRAMRLLPSGSQARHPLEAAQVITPTPAKDEILVRIGACAVCRTDLQLRDGELPAHALPVTPGHQIVGRVVDVGEGVSGLREGDRVGIAWLAGACGVCARCAEGRENLCERAQFTGWDRDGGYAQYVTARADFALRIPEAFDDVAAAPLLCGGVIGYRALEVSAIRPGQRLGLYGFGASATLTLQVARHWGCRVFVVTRSEAEQARAMALGAEWAGGYDERPPVRLDAAITFAPVGSVVVAALSALERGGTVVVNAIHLDEVPALAYEHLWWERAVRSVANFTRADARAFLELAARAPIRTFTEVFPLEQANVALDRLASGAIRGAAVIAMRE
jgi:propanol-preferring alcohol dehydrogenase